MYYDIGDCNTIGKMHNAFINDGRHEAKAYVKKLKGIHFHVDFLDVREHVEIIFLKKMSCH